VTLEQSGTERLLRCELSQKRTISLASAPFVNSNSAGEFRLELCFGIDGGIDRTADRFLRTRELLQNVFETDFCNDNNVEIAVGSLFLACH
jgi:hypothetical protein